MARNDLGWRPAMFLAKISISVCTYLNILSATILSCFGAYRNDMSLYLPNSAICTEWSNCIVLYQRSADVGHDYGGGHLKSTSGSISFAWSIVYQPLKLRQNRAAGGEFYLDFYLIVPGTTKLALVVTGDRFKFWLWTYLSCKLRQRYNYCTSIDHQSCIVRC